MTETWLTSKDEAKRSECEPVGYTFKDHPRESNRPGGGTGLLCRSPLTAKKITGANRSSFEFSEWLVSGPKLNIRVVVIYRPPYSAEHPVTARVFFEEFAEYMESVIVSKEPLIITGDFNFHVDDGRDTDACNFMDMINSLGLDQHMKGPTHRSGHTLDLIMTRNTGEVSLDTPSAAYYISDHAFIHCYVSLPKPSLETKNITFRQLKKINIEQFREDMRSSPLCQEITSGNTIQTPDDLDRLVKIYVDTLRGLVNKHAPVKNKTITVRPKVPWFSADLKKLKQARRKAERDWRQFRNDPTKSNEKHLEFKQHRNDCRQSMDSARTRYYSDKVLECSGDQKKLFALISTLTSPSKCVQYPDHSSPLALANEFGEFFIMKIDKIRNALDQLEVPSIEPIREPITDQHKLTSFQQLQLTDIHKLIKRAPNKQCASDPIPTWMLKECTDIIAPFITNMINMSLEIGYFPSEWKNALVTPLLKKQGLELIFPNFRPVSNLPFVSKLAERVCVEQLTQHMEQNHPLPSHQSAYRACHSTETALIKVHSDILLSMDTQKVTLLVMLDLSAAFDTIDHHILLETLEFEAGVCDTALHWFISYLNDRTQQVQVCGTTSEKMNLKSGVPQGSCLGPVLFTLYAASLFKVIRNHLPNCHGYADDHQLYVSFQPRNAADQDSAVSSLQNCIAEVRAWMLVNKLKINDSKTEFLILGSKQQLQKVNIKGVQVGDENIEPVTSVRNLGVIFDQNLAMDKHISKVCRTAFFHLHNIRGIRKYLTHDAACSIVHAFVSSQLDYCNSLLSGLPSCLVKKLQRVQNSAARVILDISRFDHITPALIKLHWLPVKFRIKFKVLLIVFKAIHGLAPIYISEMITRVNNSRYTLRSNEEVRLYVPKYKCKTFGLRSFAINGPSLWNSLPCELRSLVNIELFKKRLKTHLFVEFLNVGQ